MREIKFRFWNGKKMIQPTKYADILIKGDGEIYCWIDIDENSGLVPVQEYVPLQFTGIKDKNGVEIYDGDIISINGELLAVEWKEYPDIGEDSQDYIISGFILRMWREWAEVVGNIYQNRDLLKDEYERI